MCPDRFGIEATGSRLEPFPIWTQCGRRFDLIARIDRWQPLDLRAVIEDVDAVWNGHDATAWDSVC